MISKIIQRVNDYSKPISALTLSLWALFLRFKCLAGRELWGDEMYQLRHTIGAFKPFWKRMTYGDFSCFPGDYLLTYPFVRFFQPNKWGMAIPHILVTIAGFFLLYALCKRHFKTVWGYIVTFSIVCFNQHLIFHSFELRPYAVLPTLAIASCYLADILVAENIRMPIGKKVLIGLFFVITSCFHAFGIMIAFLPLVFFTFAERANPSFKIIFKDIFKFSLAVFVVAFPLWLWYALGNPMNFPRDAQIYTGRNTFTYIRNPLRGFWPFFDRVVFYNLIGYKRLNFFLGGLVFFVFVPYKEKLKKLAFFLVLIILPIEMILLAALRSGYWFLIRQYIYTAPLLAFFLGWLWDSSIYFYIDREQRRFTFFSVIGLGLIIVCSVAGITGLLLYA